jgi:acetyl-CoA carboxylase carboxyl transferase subunit alpha
MRASARKNSMHNYLDFEKPISDLEGKILELRKLAPKTRASTPARKSPASKPEPATPWRRSTAAQSLAENPGRPTSGPAAFQGLCRSPVRRVHAAGRRPQIRRRRRHPGRFCPVSRSAGRLVGQEKGHDTKTRIHHNFGPPARKAIARQFVSWSWPTVSRSRWSP